LLRYQLGLIPVIIVLGVWKFASVQRKRPAGRFIVGAVALPGPRLHKFLLSNIIILNLGQKNRLFQSAEASSSKAPTRVTQTPHFLLRWPW
jgi:hypothetical protein